LANVINSAGGSLKDFGISVTSANVHSSDVISDNSLKIKEYYIEIAKGKLLCFRFDTKIIKQYIYGANINVERLALVVLSHNIYKEQLGDFVIGNFFSIFFIAKNYAIKK
jgi:hypothetical protein